MRRISELWDEMRGHSSVNKVDSDRQDSSTSPGMHTQVHMQMHKCYVHPTITDIRTCKSATHHTHILQNKKKLSVVRLSCLQDREMPFLFLFLLLSSFWRNFYNNYMNFPCPECSWSCFILWPPSFCHGCHGKTALSACQRKPHSPALPRQCGAKGGQGEQITI